MGRIEDFLRKSKLDHERAVGKRIPIGANYSKQSLMNKSPFKSNIASIFLDLALEYCIK